MIEHGPLLERLLAGEFICQVSDEVAFAHLNDEQTAQDFDHYLRPLNRRLVKSDSGGVFYLGYVNLTPTAREQLAKQFSETIQSLLPLLEWMQLVQEAMGQDRALTAGDTLKLQEFVLRCEDNQSLRQRLQTLALDRFFNSHSDALDNQVKLIFRRLKEHGYLLQPHSERHYYIVTGKIDYLIEVIDFIRHEEHLPIDDAPTQEELI
ncbi:condensin complex protein MksE [Celerinatantimonas sp. MCCC 1A17872]|uniref:condensin complex protein MksE n=1 Tax=Celerinatantimonas sp. MCCC 1A17872 TaxID=3177514 RepID=UPI0038CB6502